LQAVMNNGSVYIHAIFTPTGASPNPSGALLAMLHACRPAGMNASRLSPPAALPGLTALQTSTLTAWGPLARHTL